MAHRTAPEGRRVLVSDDAQNVAALLEQQGYLVDICPTIADVARKIDEDVGVVLVTDKALADDVGPLAAALSAQPHWSDVPLVLLTDRQMSYPIHKEGIRRRLPDNAINVVLLERPLSDESLLSAVASAMRGRQKQFEIRDRIAELDAERIRLSALLDHLPVGVAFVDKDAETILSNPAYRRFLPTGQVPSRLPDGEERWIGYDEHGERIRRDRFVTVRALKGETVTGVEFRYRPIEGDEVWTRVSGIPLTDGEGAVTGSISVIVDIDEQKRAQEALAQAAQKLEGDVAARTAELEEALLLLQAEAAERERAESALRQSQKMEAVGQLTGGIAHDFNNILTGVIGALDIMKRRIATGRLDDLERYMDIALTSAQRAAGLTARLLAFSRRQSLDSRPTDINALVRSLEDLLHRTMSEKVDISILPGDDVPPGVVDANQLESAIINLAINARDAMPDGGKLTLETSVTDLDDDYIADRPGIAPGRYVVVAVSDTGVGMDSSTLEKVFEPFYTTKPIGQGTGLGLSMVYGFAKQSNGQVRIHSSPGIGTSVKLYLPVAEQWDDSPDNQTAQIIEEGSGQTVLLVEDDDSVRLLIGEVLEELGYAAAVAAEPETAIRMLQTGRTFDLVISDVGLPGMNGRQLAEIARQHLPDVPILFVTGYAENATARAGFLGENMDMITKPFQIELLSVKISEMLGGTDPSPSV